MTDLFKLKDVGELEIKPIVRYADGSITGGDKKLVPVSILRLCFE